MKIFLILCALCGLIASATPSSDRIIGGTDAPLARYMVSLRDTANQHFCGGFINHMRWILTTAHCVRTRTIQDFTLHMGTNSRSEVGEKYAVQCIEIHPQYDRYLMMNNLALVQTVGIITPTGTVRPIAISFTDLPPGTKATVSGWGKTSVSAEARSPGEGVADIMQQLQVTTITREQCLAQHSNLNGRYIYENTTCTTAPSGKGVCSGDGGNPLVIVEGGTDVVVGIASWNMPCGTGTPDVYVRLSSYIDWINLIAQ